MTEQSLRQLIADSRIRGFDLAEAILKLHREDVIKELKEARFSDDIPDSEIKRLSDIQDYIIKRIAQLRDEGDKGNE